MFYIRQKRKKLQNVKETQQIILYFIITINYNK